MVSHPKKSLVAADAARLVVDAAAFPFDDTSTLEPAGLVIGQSRAAGAIDFALRVDDPHFNLFVAGPPGTGKSTLVPKLAAEIAATKPESMDWVFVHNFDDADRPLPIALAPGDGRILAGEMRRFVETMQKRIPAALATREHRSRQQALLEEAIDERRTFLSTLEEKARAHGIGIDDTSDHLQLVPLDDEGVEMTPEAYDALDEPARKAIEARERSLRDDILEFLDEARRIQDRVDDALERVDRETVARLVEPAIRKVQRSIGENEHVEAYLEEVADNVVDTLDAFAGSDAESPFERHRGPTVPPERLEVNVVVDNGDARGAPVIVEWNPTYTNLIGRVERRANFGALETNHMLIRAGALARASGGFLIISAEELLTSPFAYPALKRCLRDGHVTIEDADDLIQGVHASSLRPAPLPVRTRVIMIGSLEHYVMLRELDDDFSRLFKVRADFTHALDRSADTSLELCRFAAARCNEAGLLHLDRTGAAAFIEYASRLAGRHDEVSLLLVQLGDLLVEADFWARRAGKPHIDRAGIREADLQRRERDGVFREHTLREFSRGTLLVALDGARIGQVNGLSVIGIGDVDFGVPCRITAKAFAGAGGVVNIERETELSGQIHSKATLILQGYLGDLYARERALALSASLTFEQNYNFIEGDSASVAEAVALLSAISELPVRQDLAVTGSMSQHGEVQPIGGVNEKIEGFFDVCAQRGLSGTQGVVVPRTNASQLHVDDRVIDAMREGMFHIYAIDTIDEALEILLGVEAGALDADGRYPPDSVHARVVDRLEIFSERNDEKSDKSSDQR